MSVHDLVKNGKVVDYQSQFTDPISLLNYWAKIDQDKLALVFDAGKGQQTEAWTYGELAEQVNIMSNWLLSIKRQAQQIDQVDKENSQDQTINQSINNLPPTLAFAFENTPEVILLNLAAWQAGWCSVPLDTTRDTLERKIYKLKQSNCQLLFVRGGETKADELTTIQQELPNLTIISVNSVQNLLDFANKHSLDRQTDATLVDRHPQLVSGSSNSVKTSTLISSPTDQQPQSTKQPTLTTSHQQLTTSSQQLTTSSQQLTTSSQQLATSSQSPALILYTSGTTALPKGAILTWNSLTANAESIADWLQFTSRDRWLVVMPLHHINSTTFSLTTLLSGGTIILVPKYSKSHFWSTLAKHACTGTSIVPTIAFDQLSETDQFDQHQANLHQLTRIQLGSAPVQPSSVKQFVDRFGIKLVQGYGQTETSLRSTGVPIVTSNINRQIADTPSQDSFSSLSNQSDNRSTDQDQYSWAVNSNTLGTELKYTNVTILDEKGTELPADVVGEICVRGPIIMQQYLGNSEATTAAFTHNWFHSGDTGYWQNHFGQKYFFLKGRAKEIIKKGGVLISPLAIENALLNHHPDLHQAYVIGFPDQRLGEQIGLIGVGEPGAVNRLIQASKTGQLTGLEAYEFPVAGLQLNDEDLPKTSTGKIQRVELRNLYAGKLLEQYRTIASSYHAKLPSEMSSPKLVSESSNSTKVSVLISSPTDQQPQSTKQPILTASHQQPATSNWQPATGNQQPTLTFRLLGPEESDLLEQAVNIDRQRWGVTLAGSKEQFIERATHGVLIGCIDDNQQLLGTISALRINQSDLDHAGKPQHWTSTWVGVTGKGTLITHNHKGDSLLLVAVASLGKNSRHAELVSASSTDSRHPELVSGSSNSVNTPTPISYHQPNPSPIDLAKITAYCQSTQDPVLSFHYAPKGGLSKGARFLKLLPNARPADYQALGFCVLVQYPTLDQLPTITPTASIGTQLVEATLLFAYQNGIKNVFAYSRPVGLRGEFLL